jgi:hypothetical protein
VTPKSPTKLSAQTAKNLHKLGRRIVAERDAPLKDEEHVRDLARRFVAHKRSPKATKAIRELSRKLLDLQRALKQDAPSVDAKIKALDDEVGYFLRSLPDTATAIDRRIALNETILAQHGWFISFWDTPLALLNSTASRLDGPAGKQADETLASHMEGLIPSLKEAIAESFPARQVILADAFDAHDGAKYTLSIPVFLAQADGIGAASFGVESIYSLSSGIAKFRDFIQNKLFPAFAGEYSYHYLITARMPINASRGKRKHYPGMLNRHSVLHGESTDYPTRINSCKAISWLQYILSFHHHMELAQERDATINVSRASFGP